MISVYVDKDCFPTQSVFVISYINSVKPVINLIVTEICCVYQWKYGGITCALNIFTNTLKCKWSLVVVKNSHFEKPDSYYSWGFAPQAEKKEVDILTRWREIAMMNLHPSVKILVVW